MYDASNRKVISEDVKNVSIYTEMDDQQILEKAIELVEENAPVYRELIHRLAATAQSLSGLQPILGLDEQLKNLTDRSKAIA